MKWGNEYPAERDKINVREGSQPKSWCSGGDTFFKKITIVHSFRNSPLSVLAVCGKLASLDFCLTCSRHW